MLKKQNLFIAVFLVILTTPVFSQTPPPGGNPSAGAPLDGLSSVLLLTAGAMGVYRLRTKLNGDETKGDR